MQAQIAALALEDRERSDEEDKNDNAQLDDSSRVPKSQVDSQLMVPWAKRLPRSMRLQEQAVTLYQKRIARFMNLYVSSHWHIDEPVEELSYLEVYPRGQELKNYVTLKCVSHLIHVTKVDLIGILGQLELEN